MPNDCNIFTKFRPSTPPQKLALKHKTINFELGDVVFLTYPGVVTGMLKIGEPMALVCRHIYFVLHRVVHNPTLYSHPYPQVSFTPVMAWTQCNSSKPPSIFRIQTLIFAQPSWQQLKSTIALEVRSTITNGRSLKMLQPRCLVSRHGLLYRVQPFPQLSSVLTVESDWILRKSLPNNAI